MKSLLAGVALLIILVASPCVLLAGGSVTVSFTGKDVVHLAVVYTPAGEGYTSVRLMHSAGAVVVGTYSASQPLDASVRVGELVFGNQYQFVLQGWDEDTESWINISSASKKLQSIEGTLLFDESLTDLGDVGLDITIPDGISCGIGGLQGENPIPRFIKVYGSLGIIDPESMLPLWIDLYSQNVLQLPSGSSLWVHPGAAGSAFTESDDLYLYVNADDIRLRDCTNVRLEKYGANTTYPEEGDQAGLLFFERCTVNTFTAPSAATHRLRFLECEISNLEWQAGEVQLEKSETGRLVLREDAILDATGTKISRIEGFDRAEIAVVGCYVGSIVCSADEAVPDEFDCLIQDSEILFSISLGGVAGEIRNCVLGDTLGYSAATNSSRRPVVTGNSFLGYEAIRWSAPATKGVYDIGPNFYGDQYGPVYDSGPPEVVRDDFLSHRGGRVTAYEPISDTEYRQILALAEPLTSGRYFVHFNPLPEIWVAGWIAGQNTLSHDLYSVSGSWNSLKETLVCVDIVATDELVQGVEIYAMIGSTQQRIDPINGPVVLRRDSGGFNGIENLTRGRTVAFLLPPAGNESGQTLNLRVDRSNLTGYDQEPPTEPEYLDYFTITNPPTRRAVPRDRLRIVVQPVELDMWFYPSGTPSGEKFARELEATMAAMLPVRRDELDIVALEPITYSGNLSTFSVTALLNGLSTELALLRTLSNVTAAEDIDFVVAVLKRDAMGSGTTGASLALRRSIIIVDESDPQTTLHEMGHALDLYKGWGQEQYDLFPPTGIDCARMTAFINVDGVRLTGFDRTSRFRHFPAPNNPLFADSVPFTDVMGGGTGNKWPIADTLAVFDRYLFNRLYNGTVKDEEMASPRQSSATRSGIRNLLFTAVLERTDPADPVSGRLQSGSFRTMNMGDTLTESTYLASQGTGEGFLVTGEHSTNPDLEMTFYPRNLDPNPVESDIVFGRIDFPDAYERITIRRLAPPQQILASIPAATLEAQITFPGNGSNLGETETVRWQVTGTSPAITQRPGPLDVLMPLQSFLFIKRATDPGWRLVGKYETETEGTISTTPFVDGEQVSIRVHVTDGFQSSTAEVHNLVVSPRVPRVFIVSPETDVQIETGLPMAFEAATWDSKGSTSSAAISWNSSIDGLLGTGWFLENIVLSEGTHTITATATDPGGLFTTQSVEIAVGPLASVDFAVSPTALTVTGPGLDPTAAGGVRLVPGTTYRARAQFQNIGIVSNQTFRISLKSPGLPGWQTLREQTIDLQPFDSAILSGDFVPVAGGEYILRAEIVATNPADAEPANNAQSWTYSTEAAPSQAILGSVELDFGPVFGNNQPSRQLAIANLGEADLLLSVIRLVGANPEAFLVFSAPSPTTPIPYGEAGIITLRLVAGEVGEVKTAMLMIETNDPLRPVLQIPVRAEIVPGSPTPQMWLLH